MTSVIPKKTQKWLDAGGPRTISDAELRFLGAVHDAAALGVGYGWAVAVKNTSNVTETLYQLTIIGVGETEDMAVRNLLKLLAIQPFTKQIIQGTMVTVTGDT